jgi:hypothetical protein
VTAPRSSEGAGSVGESSAGPTVHQLPAREIVDESAEEVPEFDPWAHRRTEPRPLAFFWSMFLAVATLIALGSVAATGIVTHDVYRPAVRSVLALIAVGLTVLWPMMRLSQTIPASRTRAWIAKDIVVLLAPTQAVIWPQGFFFLAWWPWSVVAALAALLGAWTILIGAMLAIACDRIGVSGRAPRARWMGGIVFAAIAGPIVAIGTLPAPKSTEPDLRMMTSAMSAIFEIGKDRAWTGRPTAVYPGHWWAVGVTLGVASVLWIAPIPARRVRFGARDSLGVGLDKGTGLDSVTTNAPRLTSKDPGSPGAAEARSPAGG